jgi:hypothetical protein
MATPPDTSEYFVYEAGDGRMLSLYLLPDCYVSMQFPARQRCPPGSYCNTQGAQPVLLERHRHTAPRRGEFLVAELEMPPYGPPYNTAELCMLRPDHDLELKQVPLVHNKGDGAWHSSTPW